MNDGRMGGGERVGRAEVLRPLRAPDLAGAAVAPDVDVVEGLVAPVELRIDAQRIRKIVLEAGKGDDLLDVVIVEVEAIVETGRAVAIQCGGIRQAAGADLTALGARGGGALAGAGGST